ncbi:hypothetical protein EDC04DRAFT_2616284 [Pisolithus marmoratus]|nr:hypothetical protein EDC04DRAFT_2616284 [Pisolithus marmoratus]
MREGEPEYDHLVLAKFLNAAIPTFDHAGDNCLNLTEDALSLDYRFQLLAFPTAPSWTLLTLRRPKYEGSSGHMMLIGYIPYSSGPIKQISTTLTERQTREFITFETILLTCTYLDGKRFTLADITAAFVIFLSVPYSADALLRAGHPNTLRHLDFTVQLKLKEAFGQPTFVEKAVWYIPPEKPKKAEEDDKKDTNVVPEESKPMISYCHRRPISSTTRRARWFSVALRKESFSIYLTDVKHDKALTLVFILSDQIGSFFNSSGGSM